MLLATPAPEAPAFLSATSPESTMPKQLVLTEADLASRWAMSPKTLQRWRMTGRKLEVQAPANEPVKPLKPPQDLSLPPNHAWYLVHTKARQEDTAITNLQRQNFRCYMPMLYLEKVRRGKPVVVAEPMFPSYVFVQLDTSGQGQSWSPIRSTLGVRELVKFGGHPPKVDAELITALHEREQLQQSNPQALFAAGDKVVITDGPFAGIEAIYQTTDAERRSMILLSMLNKPVAMRIEPAQLRKCG